MNIKIFIILLPFFFLNKNIIKLHKTTNRKKKKYKYKYIL